MTFSVKEYEIETKLAIAQVKIAKASEVDLIIPEALPIATVTVPFATLQQYLHDVERDDLNAKFFRQNAIHVAEQQLSDLRA